LGALPAAGEEDGGGLGEAFDLGGMEMG